MLLSLIRGSNRRFHDAPEAIIISKGSYKFDSKQQGPCLVCLPRISGLEVFEYQKNNRLTPQIKRMPGRSRDLMQTEREAVWADQESKLKEEVQRYHKEMLDLFGFLGDF